MSKLTKIDEFIIFCLEAYKNKYELRGEDVLNLFQKFKIFSFLENGYDVLHTQSMEYIISEIHQLIKNQE
jgi:hypothetical protein